MLTYPAILMLSLTACMAWVVISDTIYYTIPNILNAVILALFVVGVIMLPIATWPSALAAAGIVLVGGLGLFALGLMGGGDIKLLVVLSLWTGWGMATVQFIFFTAIFGGILVLVVLILRRIAAPLIVKSGPTHNPPRILTPKQPVPYGIAIALAFGWLLWTGGVPVLS